MRLYNDALPCCGAIAQLGERNTGRCWLIFILGDIAQLGERITGSDKVVGSIPSVSTTLTKSRLLGKAKLFSMFHVIKVCYKCYQFLIILTCAKQLTLVQVISIRERTL